MKLSRNFQVGIFVLIGLALAGVVIFLIGDERKLFSRSVSFQTRFLDVAGLRPGAPVRMGGLDIGHVGEVGYGKDMRDPTIYVTLDIVQSQSERIRSDCVAQVATRGLLGDKIIEIGSTAEHQCKTGSPVPPGGQILSEEPGDMFGKFGNVAAKAEGALENIEQATAGLADEKFQQDLRETMSSIRTIMKEVAGGEGYPNRFLTDKSEAERISTALENMSNVSRELEGTMREARAVMARINHGPGFAHDLIHGDGPEALPQFGSAASEVAQTLRGIRESDSFAHDLLYGGDSTGSQAIDHVTEMTKDLRAIVADVRAGKGTIGALLVDPSIYDDLKVIVGNVERNDVLRALVRYSIKKDEQKPRVNIASPK